MKDAVLRMKRTILFLVGVVLIVSGYESALHNDVENGSDRASLESGQIL